MTLNLKVHEYKRINDGSRAVLTRVNPYVVLTRGLPEGGSTRVFIQGGAFYHEKGDEYKPSELPDWLDEEIKKMSPASRREAGLTVRKDGDDEDD